METQIKIELPQALATYVFEKMEERKKGRKHLVAHLWLLRTNYDYGLVSELGWEDINTLRQVYGGLPPQILISKIVSLSQQKISNGGFNHENRLLG